jgi:23S rRNA (guanosine2251-2'-O)-methyltransferase
MSKARYVAGLRAVEQLLQTNASEVRRIYAEYRSANPRVKAVLDRARDAGLEVQSANRARLKQISGEVRHQGVVAEINRTSVLDEAALRTRVEARLSEDRGLPLLLLVLDGIQDPHNLGACLRTADAAGVDAVVAPRHGAAGLGPTVSKVAAGAAEALPFAQVINIGKTLDWLGEYGVTRVGTSDRGVESLYDMDASGPVALVMGREEKGVSRAVLERCDHIVSLPMSGQVSSLNVSVAAGVCLYEIVRQRRASQPR